MSAVQSEGCSLNLHFNFFNRFNSFILIVAILHQGIIDWLGKRSGFVGIKQGQKKNNCWFSRFSEDVSVL